MTEIPGTYSITINFTPEAAIVYVEETLAQIQSLLTQLQDSEAWKLVCDLNPESEFVASIPDAVYHIRYALEHLPET
jgi:hypothetical protein